MPKTLTKIGDGAFIASAINITKLPETLTDIGVAAFMKCKNLNELTIPSKIININAGVFEHCSNLNSITLPEGLLSIEEYAFAECQNLQTVSLDKTSQVRILPSAFKNCKKLNWDLTEYANMKILNFAFESCPHVIVPDTSPNAKFERPKGYEYRP